jgi:hypothetical protein
MLREVQRFVTAQLNQLTGKEEERLTECLVRLLAAFDISEVIEAALTPESISSVARCSYRHPNGFTKIVLIPFAGESTPFELRVHDWKTIHDPAFESQSLVAQSIHDHGWNFASFLAKGALAFEEFALSEEGQEFVEFEYIRPDESIRFVLNPIGTARLACTCRGVHQHPDVYFFGRGRLHRSLPVPSERTISLLLQGPAVANHGLVYRDPRFPEQQESPAERALMEEELVQTVTSICEALRKPVTGCNV